jgi:hypothetical protein
MKLSTMVKEAVADAEAEADISQREAAESEFWRFRISNTPRRRC